jgi:hypothetical protein
MPHKKYKHTGIKDSSRIKEELLMPSTIETIDFAFYDWLNEKMDIFSPTSGGWKKVPIIWVSSERAFQLKNNKDLRDSNGTLKLPLMTLERTSVVKDPNKKGTAWGNIPPVRDAKGGSIVIARRIQQDKTAAFANADSAKKINKTVGHGQINFRTRKENKKVVYETVSIPMPVYLEITYDIVVRGEYLQQMNEILTPFMVRTGGINYFNLYRDGHRYEGFIQQEFSQNNNAKNMGEDERTYESTIQIKVLGYIIGSDKNEDQPKIVTRENAVEVKQPREKFMTSDKPQHIDKRGKYRE